MAILTSNNQKYLLRRLSQNDVVLFLGAGFSKDVSNRLSQPMPLSDDICEALWGLPQLSGQLGWNTAAGHVPSPADVW